MSTGTRCGWSDLGSCATLQHAVNPPSYSTNVLCRFVQSSFQISPHHGEDQNGRWPSRNASASKLDLTRLDAIVDVYRTRHNDMEFMWQGNHQCPRFCLCLWILFLLALTLFRDCQVPNEELLTRKLLSYLCWATSASLCTSQPSGSKEQWDTDCEKDSMRVRLLECWNG